MISQKQINQWTEKENNTFKIDNIDFHSGYKSTTIYTFKKYIDVIKKSMQEYGYEFISECGTDMLRQIKRGQDYDCMLNFWKDRPSSWERIRNYLQYK